MGPINCQTWLYHQPYYLYICFIRAPTFVALIFSPKDSESLHSVDRNVKWIENVLLSATPAECILIGHSVTSDLLPFFVLLCVVFVISVVAVSSVKQYSYKKMLRGYRVAIGSVVSFLPCPRIALYVPILPHSKKNTKNHWVKLLSQNKYIYSYRAQININ